MASVAGLNNFNNLLYATKKRAIVNVQEHRAGRVPMDLRYKGEDPINEVLTCKVSQLNGKRGDLKYEPKVLKSRPYYGYDAPFDPTILNCIRNKFVDVSGTLIPNRHLAPLTKNIPRTVMPLRSYGMVI